MRTLGHPREVRDYDMGRAFDLMWEAVLGSWRAVQALLASGGWDPRTWTTPAWVVVGAALLLIVALIVRAARSRGRALPELLLSHGELVFVDDAEGGSPFVAAPVIAPANAHYQLRMTLSNLNAFPLQLLELAVRARGLNAPVVAEAAAVVPPHGSVDVVADFFDMPGDAGQVEVYLFSTRMRGRTLRMSAPLEWEPWDRRYRVKALASRITLGRALASQQRTRRARRAYQREQLKQRSSAATQEAMRRADDLRRSISERRQAARQRSIEAGEALGALHGAASGSSAVGGVGGSMGSRDGVDAGSARTVTRAATTDAAGGPALGRPRTGRAPASPSGAVAMAQEKFRAPARAASETQRAGRASGSSVERTVTNDTPQDSAKVARPNSERPKSEPPRSGSRASAPRAPEPNASETAAPEPPRSGSRPPEPRASERSTLEPPTRRSATSESDEKDAERPRLEFPDEF
ncbi:MAG: hypothetical protein R6W77_00370 [Trueperaceae bacterium]